MSISIKPTTLKFLKDLDKNNDREWFTKHKQTYLNAYENVMEFADKLITEMNRHDEIEETSGKQSMYRIYRDVRFSKEKTPYNPRFAIGLQRSTKLRRGGYYLNIKPGNCFLACGFWGPNAADLKRIREDIDYNYRQWNKILNAKSIKQNFGALTGDKVNTAPRGFDAGHPAIDLLRHKQFILRHNFTDKEATAPAFLKEVNSIFKSVRPYLNYMSEILTTNANGELIIK